jgi:hypothetical protein
MVFLCLQANAEKVPQFRVAAACFSSSPPDWNLLRFNPLLWTPQNYICKFGKSQLTWKSKFHCPCSQRIHRTYYLIWTPRLMRIAHILGNFPTWNWRARPLACCVPPPPEFSLLYHALRLTQSEWANVTCKLIFLKCWLCTSMPNT